MLHSSIKETNFVMASVNDATNLFPSQQKHSQDRLVSPWRIDFFPLPASSRRCLSQTNQQQSHAHKLGGRSACHHAYHNGGKKWLATHCAVGGHSRRHNSNNDCPHCFKLGTKTLSCLVLQSKSKSRSQWHYQQNSQTICCLRSARRRV